MIAVFLRPGEGVGDAESAFLNELFGIRGEGGPPEFGKATEDDKLSLALDEGVVAAVEECWRVILIKSRGCCCGSDTVLPLLPLFSEVLKLTLRGDAEV
jgi:hypothetical protein